jgi:hypothetical protein
MSEDVIIEYHHQKISEILSLEKHALNYRLL